MSTHVAQAWFLYLRNWAWALPDAHDILLQTADMSQNAINSLFYLKCFDK
jgi:hypothetical protein